MLLASSSSSSELSLLLLMGPHSLRSVTSKSGIFRPYSGRGSLWEFVGRPTTSLVVVLDSIPKAVSEIKLNRDEQVVVVCKVSLLISFRCVCSMVFLS